MVAGTVVAGIEAAGIVVADTEVVDIEVLGVPVVREASEPSVVLHLEALSPVDTVHVLVVA